MIELPSSRLRALRARAHALNPVASISQNGLGETVLAEVDRSLRAHELIKVRVYGAGREARAALLAEICTRLEAAPIQHIGNILVIFRANPEAPCAPALPPTKPRSRPGAKAAAGPRARRRQPAR